MKSDANIKGIVVASIRRHSMDMDTWIRTRLWDDGDSALKDQIQAACRISPEELPILYSYVDRANWTFVTTRHIWSSNHGIVESVAATEVAEERSGNFKGYGNQSVEKVELKAKDGRVYWCPFETGKPSMGTICAIRTLRQLRGAA